MDNFPERLRQKLEQRAQDNALRSLVTSARGIDFSSNDYLGYAALPVLAEDAVNLLRQSGVNFNGATGSRLISGNHGLYESTEALIAAFHQAPAALMFNSGYDANVGLFSCLPQKGDVVLYDAYIHASIRDGLRLSGATSHKFGHNDPNALDSALKRAANASGRHEVYVITESVFSMDGDSPDLGEMIRLCEHYNARLIVDEAHAVGIFGTNGEGIVQALDLQDNIFARVVTFGKALGSHGAAVLGSVMLRDYLTNFARSLIYTTGLPPHSVAAVAAGYAYAAQDSKARDGLRGLVSFFRSEYARLGLVGFIASNSPIQCIVIPGNDRVKDVAHKLGQAGYGVKPILSPTVPPGQERLRLCLHSYNTNEQVTGVLELLTSLLR